MQICFLRHGRPRADRCTGRVVAGIRISRTSTAHRRRNPLCSTNAAAAWLPLELASLPLIRHGAAQLIPKTDATNQFNPFQASTGRQITEVCTIVAMLSRSLFQGCSKKKTIGANSEQMSSGRCGGHENLRICYLRNGVMRKRALKNTTRPGKKRGSNKPSKLDTWRLTCGCERATTDEHSPCDNDAGVPRACRAASGRMLTPFLNAPFPEHFVATPDVLPGRSSGSSSDQSQNTQCGPAPTRHKPKWARSMRAAGRSPRATAASRGPS